MRQFDVVSFREYRIRMRPALEEIARFLELTPLAEVEDLSLRLAHLLENRDIAVPQNGEGSTVHLLIAKAIAEVTGFAACCRAGSLWAAYHHMRAMLELYAATVHLVVDPSERPRRFKQFQEYDVAAAYREHLLSSETGEEHLRIAPDDPCLAFMKTRELLWCELYGHNKLTKLRTWHHPVSIKDLLRQCDQRSPNDSGRWQRLYSAICNPTHVSPLGHKAVGVSGLPVLAMPKDIAFVHGKIVLVGYLLMYQIELWDKHYIPNGRLASRTKVWVDRFLAAVMSTKPENSAL